MLISYNWLKQFIQLDWKAEKVGELLTNLGLELEGISSFESVTGGLQGVVVGEVLHVEKHPNADKLTLTRVDIGQEEPLQIVCGAPNVAKGQKVPVATIGTTLYTPEGESWKIKKGKIRGEESHGMICAEDELGLGDSHEGIMVLDPASKPGTQCSTLFELENDEVFNIDLTPNRADAMSHYGVARDLRAGLARKEIMMELITPSLSHFNVDNRSRKIDVIVEDSALAPRYCGVTISDMIVQPSPDWLKNRLRAIGLKPINNVVDATNYVLHELGQPLHAFDADRIFGNEVIVKRVKAGTKFITLDGIERELHAEDLMICDKEKPMCIGGIFGGINTGVTEDTKAIFLESAYFDPVSIRKSAKRHGLSTDASFRFERGIDINITLYALQRAALLIKELTGGSITSDLVDLYPKKKEDHQVFLTFNKINSLIGQEIPRDDIKAILASLEIQVKSVTESGLGLEIPSYRVDVQREVDVIEEILRVYGYNEIATPAKFNASVAKSSPRESYKLEDVVSQALVANGFFEMVNNSLTHAKYATFLGEKAAEATVAMLNPLSADLSAMRQSLLFSGLESIAHNLNRQLTDLKLFEFGNVYRSTGSGREEEKQLALFLSGNTHEDHWASPNQASGFFELKGYVDLVLKRLGIHGYSEVPGTSPLFTEQL
ncbi:MAG: phenylalanine--tRNA ligase subunit beta, partial [Bacteroidia bacterium]|nr:phenylalanine--tRNA ligase subunit beta [Bacteroidia bacterium]